MNTLLINQNNIYIILLSKIYTINLNQYLY